jgi:hypothetical protein
VSRSDWAAARSAGGDADDRAAALLPHTGQDSLDQRGRAEEVSGEQLLDLIAGGLLNGGSVPVAGVIDQDVDRTEALPGAAHNVPPLGRAGHV